MTSGDKLAVWLIGFFVVWCLGDNLIEYHTKKLQLEELKLEKECVCRSE